MRLGLRGKEKLRSRLGGGVTPRGEPSAQFDAALQRIEDKTFGVCQMTGKPISKARLDAKPWAKYTIEAERIAESSGAR